MNKSLVSLCLGLASLIAPVYGGLMISELYIQGHQEWLEIYNTSNEQYSGTIVLSGVKSSLLSIDNIIIPGNDVIIIGDTLDMIIDQSKIVASGLSLSLNDTKAASIQLIDGSGQTQDSVYIDQDTVAEMASQKASRQKIFTPQIQEVITSIHYLANIQEPYTANPGTIYTQEQNGPTDLPDILITEVYFEGSDERIELTNIGDSIFQGGIELRGASPILKNFDINISPGDSIILADTEQMFLDPSIVQATQAGFVINDDGNIDISLWVYDMQVDTFDVEEELVLPYVDDNNSFEKVIYQNERVITIATPERVYNIDGLQIANPGKVYTVVDPPIEIQETSDEEPQEEESDEEDEEDAGDDSSCDIPTQDVKISEIYLGSENYAQYIEIYIPNALTQGILISGSLLSQSISIDISQKEGYYLITNDMTNFIGSNILQAELSFLAGDGDIEITRQDGQVLDKVDIVVDIQPTANQSLSFKQILDCTRIFGNIEPFSPGFDSVYLQYFPEGITSIQTVYVGGGGGSSCPIADEEPQDDPDTEEEEEESLQDDQTIGDIQIIDIDYDPPGSDKDRESIVFKSFLDQEANLADYKLSVSTRSSYIQLSGMLGAGSIQTFTGNHRFPNTGACVGLLHGDAVLDTYCYGSQAQDDSDTEEESSPVSQTGQDTGGQYTDYRESIVRIVDIDYNPPGSDLHNETISFSVVSGGVDFSQFSLLIKERMYAMTSFTGYVTGDVSFTANFRFPNSGACVRLLYEEYIFDTYCYDPSDDAEVQGSELDQDNDYSSYIIHIKEIIYDPPGSDKDNETITLQMLSGDTVDLHDFRLKVKTTNRLIQGVLSPGSPQTFIGNFRFPNTGACIELRRKDHIFDTVCYAATQDDPQDTDQEDTIDYANHNIEIQDIIYDPPGNDKNREELHLSIDTALYFSDDFYLLINDTKRYLRHFSGAYHGDIVLTGTFRFPNTKDSCIKIGRESFIFDEYCYTTDERKDPVKETIEEDLPNISLLAVFPNPIGADRDQEYIILRLHDKETVDLSDGYTLSINGRNKNLDGSLVHGEDLKINKALGLPNTASCVSLLYDKRITLDTFCYELPKEGYEYRTSSQGLQALSMIDLTILRNIKFKQEGNKICIRYEDTRIACRNNKIRISKEADQELRLYKNYINMVHDYMINERTPLFYNSSLLLYRDLLRDSEKLLKQGIRKQETKYGPIAVSDIDKRFDLQYNQSLLDYLSQHIPNMLATKQRSNRYSNIKDNRYLQILTQK